MDLKESLVVHEPYVEHPIGEMQHIEDQISDLFLLESEIPHLQPLFNQLLAINREDVSHKLVHEIHHETIILAPAKFFRLLLLQLPSAPVDVGALLVHSLNNHANKHHLLSKQFLWNIFVYFHYIQANHGVQIDLLVDIFLHFLLSPNQFRKATLNDIDRVFQLGECIVEQRIALSLGELGVFSVSDASELERILLKLDPKPVEIPLNVVLPGLPLLPRFASFREYSSVLVFHMGVQCRIR